MAGLKRYKFTMSQPSLLGQLGQRQRIDRMRLFTANWPADRLIGNQAPGSLLSGRLCRLSLLELVYFVCLSDSRRDDEVQPVLLVLLCEFPPLAKSDLYFYVAIALF